MRSLLTVGMLAGLAGCGCEEVGCRGTLLVDMGDLPDGDWEVAIAFDDGVVARCNFPLPFEDGAILCNHDDVGIVVTPAATSLEVSTAMADEPPWASVRVQVAPAGATALVNELIELDWDAPVYPNGKRCDAPTGCWSAMAFVDAVEPG